MVLVIFPKTNQTWRGCRKSWKICFRYVVTISPLSVGIVMERIYIFKTVYEKRSMEILRQSVIADSTSQRKGQQPDIHKLKVLSNRIWHKILSISLFMTVFLSYAGEYHCCLISSLSVAEMTVDVLITEERAESTEPNSCRCGDTEPCCKRNTNKPWQYTLEKGRLCLYFAVYCKNQPQYLRGIINSMIRRHSILALQCSYQLFSFIYLELKKKLKTVWNWYAYG